MQSYDAIVIGSGQGGNPLAHKLADRNWRVALVERRHLGGACVNFGCTPTKTMQASARIAHLARRAGDFGVRAGDVEVDLAAVLRRKDEVVAAWRGSQQKQADQRPTLDVVRGHARFTGASTVEVEGETLVSERIVIDVGARPRLPDVPGLADVPYLTSTTLLDVDRRPDHLVVLGAGYVGLEFAQMFRRFGSAVTVVEQGDQIAAREDADVAGALQAALEAEGVTFELETEVERVGAEGDGVVLDLRAAGRTERLHGSHLLVAAGRTPNTDDLGLEAAGVATDDRGHVTVDARLRTSAPGVWALGDCKGGPAFTHVSFDDHFVVLDAFVGDGRRSIDGRTIPYAVFTDPELGRVGLTEAQARAAGHDLLVGSITSEVVGRAVERGETRGYWKVVVDARTERLLGGAVLGVEGAEVVQVLSATMWADAPWTCLKDAMYIHPTLCEGLFKLMDAVAPA